MLYPENYPELDFCLGRNRFLGPDTLPEEVIRKFYETLVLHISCVQEAGVKLGVPEYQLKNHDLSKFTRNEFNAYAKHFQGGGAPDEFALAWLHHIHCNEHHWQHWMFPDGFNPKGSALENGIMEMPQHFALEMVADWQGASKAYTGSEDMTNWLMTNIPKISVHSKTAAFLRGELMKLGYGDIVSHFSFRSEVLLASNNI